MVLLVPLHTARVFDLFEQYYAKSAYSSEFLTWAVVGWLGMWLVPLFFLLAGMSSYLSLRKYSPGTFFREHARRLLIPFAFGVLVLVPPLNYFGARTNAGFRGTFWEYLTSGRFFRFSLTPGADYAGGFGPGQMWFLLFLFVFVSIALPLFMWMRPGHGGERIAREIAKRLAQPTWWWVGAGALLIVQPIPQLFEQDVALLLLLMVAGYIGMSDEAFIRDTKRYAVLATLMGLLFSVAALVLYTWHIYWTDPSILRTGYYFVRGAAMWLLLLGAVGLGARYLDKTGPVLDYLSESSYTLFILHQTLIVVIAYFVVMMPLGWITQFLLIIVPATALTFALYEVVRRFDGLRWLFGMKSKAAEATSRQLRDAE